MPEQTVEAQIISLSKPEPFTAQSGKQLTKFTSDIQVGDEIRTVDALGFHYKNLTVGGIYSLLLKTSDEYPDSNASIWSVTYLRDGQVSENPKPQGWGVTELSEQSYKASTGATQTPQTAPTTQPTLKPDFGRRFQEWNTHARTAKMQATTRGQILADLVKEGILLNEEGEVVTKLKYSTVKQWFATEYKDYWKELAESAPEDWFGALKESDNANS